MKDLMSPPMGKKAMDIIEKRASNIWRTAIANNLWKRMLRNVLATTITIAVSLINYPRSPFGQAAYLAAMATVFAHPGRRVGQVVETLSLALIGAMLGIAWTMLSLYLSSLFIVSNPSAAYAIRAVFLVLGLLFHGYFRSSSPRLYMLVLVFIIICLVGQTTIVTQVSSAFATQLIYPILLAGAAILLVNICVFPELSTTFLGTSTIAALHATSKALSDAGDYFVLQEDATDGATLATQRTRRTNSTHSRSQEVKPPTQKTLAHISGVKSSIRRSLSNCVEAQNETQFEIAFGVLPPRYLSPISKKALAQLVSNTVAIVGTCESRFALLGDMAMEAQKTRSNLEKSKTTNRHGVELKYLKPRREIAFGDVKLLRYLLGRVRDPYRAIQTVLKHSTDVSIRCIAHAYGVSKLPPGITVGDALSLAHLDRQIVTLQAAIQKFDGDVVAALRSAAVLQGLRKEEPDVMPREEVFIVSSFLINLQQAANVFLDILVHARFIYQRRQELGTRYRIYLPHIRWRKWLRTGGEEDESANSRGRTKAQESSHDSKEEEDDEISESSSPRHGHDPEQAAPHPVRVKFDPKTTNSLRNCTLELNCSANAWSVIRACSADLFEWVEKSNDFKYALKLTVATMVVTWPAFVPSLTQFYYLNRGNWAALQLIFVFEVSIGTSIFSFFVRAIGTTLGSLWGWAAFEAGHGNLFVCTIMLAIGLIPCYYVQLGSKYPRAGIVGAISMTVVAMSTELQTIPGSGTENFLKRWIAFLIGGVAALIVEVIVLPVRARDKMVASVATAIKRISEMEGCVAFGIEEGTNITTGFPLVVFDRFDRASTKAKSALGAAEIYLPACSAEPRLKGSFSGLAIVYGEIIFVLHQIIDRMDNMLLLRKTYGAGPLEELNTEVYPYRRNVAASISLVLYAVHEALTTKYPLPQFIPSARLAHLRLVNRIRDVVRQKHIEFGDNKEDVQRYAQDRARRKKYLSWNATTAASTEIIEYLEELTDLTKLLVGSSEFRSGLLMRPTYDEYVGSHDAQRQRSKSISTAHDEERVEAEEHVGDMIPMSGLTRRRTVSSSGTRDEHDLPLSLKRIQSKRQEASIKSKTNEE